MGSIQQSLEEVRRRIAGAALRSGRNRAEIELVAVSKMVDISRIREGIAAGIKILGENRVQEAEEKIAELGRSVNWHLVGHLQTNKAKLAVSLFDLIHSLDSAHLAEALNRHGQMQGKVVSLLAEVNLAREESKSGITPEALIPLLRTCSGLSHLRILGLMAIPPFFEGAEEARPYFRRLRELAAEISALGLPNIEMRHLSMGMSQDFEIAIEEGATLVRVGTAIFGTRG